MKTEDLRTRLTECADEMRAMVAQADTEKRDMSEDEAKAFDGLAAEVDTIKGQIARQDKLASVETYMAQGTGRKTEPEGMPPLEGATALKVSDSAQISAPLSERGKWGWRNLGEFAAAVRHAVRSPAQMDGRLYNAPTTVGQEGVGADGGFSVPPDFRTAIMQKVMGEDSLLSRCDQITTSGNTLVIPKDETTPWGSTGIQAYWEGENDQGTQVKPALAQTSIRLNKLMALVPMTDELLEDAPAMSTYLQRKVPEVMTHVINLAVVQGTGAGQPLGIMNGGDLVTVAKESGQAADTIVFNNIVNMWTRLYAGSRSNAVWLMHQDVEAQLMGLAFKDTAAAGPVYMPMGGFSQTPYSTLMGRPVIFSQAMETVGDLGDILVGDLSQYLAAVKTGGMRSDVSIHLWFDYDTTAFRFIFRLAGQPHWSSTISPRDGSNTLAHFVTLAARA